MKPNNKDPFFGLKFIAYCRTGLPINIEDVDEEGFASYAKWQICKVRNRLWLDPIWDQYTSEELIAEFFSIKFDENGDLRKEFERGLQEFAKSDADALDDMEKRYMAEQAKLVEEGIINEGNTVPEEFEEKF